MSLFQVELQLPRIRALIPPAQKNPDRPGGGCRAGERALGFFGLG